MSRKPRTCINCRDAPRLSDSVWCGSCAAEVDAERYEAERPMRELDEAETLDDLKQWIRENWSSS